MSWPGLTRPSREYAEAVPLNLDGRVKPGHDSGRRNTWCRKGQKMPTPILMPALSPTMEQGKLAKWLKKEGDKVVSGDVIAEIETDKATMEVEAVDEGTIGKIVVPEGTEGVPVNAPIAILLEEGEDASAISEGTRPSPQPSPPGRGSPVAAVEKASPLPGGEGQGEGRVPLNTANGHARVFASPL